MKCTAWVTMLRNHTWFTGGLHLSLMLTLTAFIANAQPSAIAPRDYQQMLKKGIDVDWWGRSEKNKYGPIRKRQLRDLHSKVLCM